MENDDMKSIKKLTNLKAKIKKLEKLKKKSKKEAKLQFADFFHSGN